MIELYNIIVITLQKDVLMYRRLEEEGEKKPQAVPPQDEMSQKMLKTRTILLTGEINKELGEKIVRQLLLLEADSDEPIKIFIDSPGGDADAGYAIYDMIRFIKPDVYTIGMGLVASAGALVLLAAPIDKRIGLPNSHYLIHQPLSGMKGVASDLQIHAEEIEKLRNKINILISNETGQTVEKVSGDTDRDFWMSASESVEYGLLSKIVTTREELGL